MSVRADVDAGARKRRPPRSGRGATPRRAVRPTAAETLRRDLLKWKGVHAGLMFAAPRDTLLRVCGAAIRAQRYRDALTAAKQELGLCRCAPAVRMVIDKALGVRSPRRGG